MRIKKLREEKHLSQQKLADMLGHGLTQQKINNYENGKYQPDIELLKVMAAFFDVSIDYLVSYSDIRKSTIELSEYKLSEHEAEHIELIRRLPSAITDRDLELLKSIHNELEKG